jgi:hypothetical protein
MCKTNPICPAVPGGSPPPLDPPASPPAGGGRAKQTQFRARPGGTGPEGRGRGKKYAKRSQAWEDWGIWGTVPQGGQWCDIASMPRFGKQTQFLPLCRSGDRRSREGRSGVRRREATASRDLGPHRAMGRF